MTVKVAVRASWNFQAIFSTAASSVSESEVEFGVGVNSYNLKENLFQLVRILSFIKKYVIVI